MSKDKMTDAIGGIGDDLIVEAKKNRGGIIVFRRIAAAAACLVLLIGVFYLTFPKGQDEPDNSVLQNTTAATVRPTTAPSIVPTTYPTQPPTTVKPTAPTTVKPIVPTTARPLSPSSSTVMPSTNNGQPAIPILVITDEDKYNQLFLAAEDVSVLNQHQDFIAAFGNQDDLKQFMNKLNKLPIPQTEGAACTILEYIPDYQMLNITLQTPQEAVYSFTFELNADRANEILEGFADRNMLVEQEWTVLGSETFKTVTAFEKLYDFSDTHGCWVEINGMLANFSCKGLGKTISAENVIEQLSIGETLIWN